MADIMDIEDDSLSVKQASFSDIQLGADFSQRYVKGEIVTVWPVTKSPKGVLKKLELKEDDPSNAKVNVFLLGSLANKYENLKKGDTIAISNMYIENSPGSSSSNDLIPYTIIVDDTRTDAKVWIISNADPAAGGSPVATRKERSGENYTYTPLAELKPNTVVNVYGVVKFFKLPKRTRGKDYSMVLSIVDISLDMNSKVTCVLFGDIMDLPMIEKVGDIVRFHRLKINLYKNTVQGTNGVGFSWLVFKKVNGDMTDALDNPLTSHGNFTLTDEDKQKVKDLHGWCGSEQFAQMNPKLSNFSHVELGQYFDVTCQVVAKGILDQGTCILLKVWDGSVVRRPFYQADLNDITLTVDERLAKRAKKYLVDVFVFDDHCPHALALKPGEYVTFYNLHAAPYKDTTDGEMVPHIEFDLHGGTSFGRGLKVVPADAVSVKRMVEVMQEVAPSDDNGGEDELAGSGAVSLLNGASSRRQTLDESEPVPQSGVQSSEVQNGGDSHPDRSEDTDRCMLVTASVITDHQHIKRTSLTEVNTGPVSGKFRICAQIMDYQPHTSIREMFFKLYCPKCHYLSQLPRSYLGNSEEHDYTSSQEADSSIQLSQSDDLMRRWECVFLRSHQRRRIKCRKLVAVEGRPIEDGPIVVEEKISDKELSSLRDKGFNIMLSSEEGSLWHETVQPLYERGGLSFYACPQCEDQQKDSEEASNTDSQILEYIYMLTFLLDDGVDWIVVNLWRGEAEKFFCDVSAKDAVKEKETFNEIINHLNKLCPEKFSTEKNSWLECCIMSHNEANGTSFNMFDTQLASLD